MDIATRGDVLTPDRRHDATALLEEGHRNRDLRPRLVGRRADVLHREALFFLVEVFLLVVRVEVFFLAIMMFLLE